MELIQFRNLRLHPNIGKMTWTDGIRTDPCDSDPMLYQSSMLKAKLLIAGAGQKKGKEA